MPGIDDLKPLITYLKETQNIKSAIALLSWDQETYMPSGSAQARAEQLSGLMGLVHERQVGQEMSKLLSASIDLETGELVTGETRCNAPAAALLREAWHDYHRATKLPESFVRELGLETALAHPVWVDARKRKDFKHFAPSLHKIVALKKRETEFLGYKDSPYDALLDAYEPDMTVAQLVPIFSSLKDKLLPLLEKIAASPHQPRIDFLSAFYDESAQIGFGEQVLTAMGFSFESGRQDLSAHPFTTSFHPSDVRLTTRVDTHDLLSSLFSSIHEGGHGLYDQGLSQAYFGTPLGETISLGIHESQSRLWENSVGRSRSFWKYFFPMLKETFPAPLKDVDLETYYAGINRVKPSLIRVESDEVTYNLHIMLRFEIERALIEEDFPVERLSERWNDMMESYLGIKPENDAEGVLQDIHWAGGAFGYFPTYTLGNLYAAQLFNQAEKEIADLTVQMEKGKLLSLKTWLNEKVHRWGRQFGSDTLIRKITGEPLSPDYFSDALNEKYTELYRLA